MPAIVDPEGKVLEGECSGNLVILRPWPGQMRAVYGDQQRFVDTYFKTYPGKYFTGDGARRDKDGYYWITGRVDDVLNVSGHRLGTAEVESALVLHKSVAEAAVVGFPHDIKGTGIYCYVTLKVGHFEVNYGDAHFRRSDNGHGIYNPFVGNTVMDPYTTEIGAEAYLRTGPFLAMVGTTTGESAGKVTAPEGRSMAKLAKLGFDKQVNSDLRVRLTASRYQTDKSLSAVLYQGDRAGSPYYLVLENVQATTSGAAWSGNLNPGFKNQLQATMINPFVKFRDLELFGIIEKSKGKESAETTSRNASQLSVDGVYRLLDDQLFVGARYNTAKAELKGYPDEVSVKRTQLSGGWFVTPSLLLKGEYVSQKYLYFPTTDIRNGGKFNGLVVSGVVAF